jgi:hypothetical protein
LTSATEGGDTVVGVASIFELVHFALEGVAYNGVRHVIVFTDAEVEQTAFGMRLQGGAFGTLDLFELVDLGPLAIAATTDTVGKKLLEPGILGGGHEFAVPLCVMASSCSGASDKTQDKQNR